MDATYWRRGSGVLFAKASNLSKIIAWKEISSEKVSDYRDLWEQILTLGYTVTSVVIDGRKGIRELFTGIPVQFCQFHQIAIVQRYLTKRPKLEASIALRKLTLTITHKEQNLNQFTQQLDQWHEQYGDFLAEKTYKDDGTWRHTHKRLYSAYNSLKKNLPYLFTHKQLPHLGIPNTTNCLDGYFSYIKSMLYSHRGAKSEMKKKIVLELIAKKPTKKP